MKIDFSAVDKITLFLGLKAWGYDDPPPFKKEMDLLFTGGLTGKFRCFVHQGLFDSLSIPEMLVAPNDILLRAFASTQFMYHNLSADPSPLQAHSNRCLRIARQELETWDWDIVGAHGKHQIVRNITASSEGVHLRVQLPVPQVEYHGGAFW